MNILIIKSGKAKLYPQMFKKYIQSKGVNCFISGYEEEKLYQVIKDQRLSPNNTLIHSRTAGSHVNNLLLELERKGFKIINSSKTLKLTSDKYKSQTFAAKNRIPTADTYLVDKNNLLKILSLLKRHHTVVAKPIYSQGKGVFCKKLNNSLLKVDVVKKIRNIPGDKIIIQEYIPYKKLIRVIVIGFKLIKEATTYDIPKKWKASVCMNLNIKKYNAANYKLREIAEKVARNFSAPIAIIDFFEDLSGDFILNELNTACGLIIHERVTGVKIHELISDYLVAAAFTNPINNGCGESGLDFNSGWNWVPTKNG